jgi:hypothetical protein
MNELNWTWKSFDRSMNYSISDGAIWNYNKQNNKYVKVLQTNFYEKSRIEVFRDHIITASYSTDQIDVPTKF